MSPDDEYTRVSQGSPFINAPGDLRLTRVLATEKSFQMFSDVKNTAGICMAASPGSWDLQVSTFYTLLYPRIVRLRILTEFYVVFRHVHRDQEKLLMKKQRQKMSRSCLFKSFRLLAGQ
jgi:hypothetical protein